MPLSGTLRDMSLANIVQFQCSEQNQAQVTLTRDSQEGILIFSSGELVYARVDKLVGDEAVYELLTWDQASFRVDNAAAGVKRNVKTPWAALMIEGLRRVDESRASHASASYASADHDNALEFRLRNLIDKRNAHAALVLQPDGVIRADARGETAVEEPAAILTTMAKAGEIGSLLGLGSLRRVLLADATESILIEHLNGDTLAFWMDARTPRRHFDDLRQQLTQTGT
jgi:hypothetical protein